MKSIFILLAAATVSTPALADPTTAAVITNPAAPTGNFDAPTNQATAGYTLTLNDDGARLNGTIQQTGGTAVGSFANLYFDLNPTVGDGSDLGFEMGTGGVTAFIPGKNGQPGFSTIISPSLYTFMTSTDVNGLINLMFSLDNSLFTGPIAGLAYYGPADNCGSGPCPAQTFEATQTLRLSQSLSYSVAGGATYGVNRLGAFEVSGAVPEPATWAMMLFGFGGIGIAMRRSNNRKTAVA